MQEGTIESGEKIEKIKQEYTMTKECFTERLTSAEGSIATSNVINRNSKARFTGSSNCKPINGKEEKQRP